MANDCCVEMKSPNIRIRTNSSVATLQRETRKSFDGFMVSVFRQTKREEKFSLKQCS